MSIKMTFIPPLEDAPAAWLPRLAAEHPQVEFRTPATGQATLAALADSDCAFGALTPELLAGAPRLRWLQAPQAAPPAGFYFDALAEHTVQVTNFRGIYNDHIAEFVLGMLLSFAKQLHRYRDLQRERRWQPLPAGPGGAIFLPEATVLIVGAGGIGLETARLAKAVGMRVLATDARRTEPHQWLDELHPAEALDSLLGAADFVVATVPHTPATEGLFDLERFRRMRPEAVFINIGRGMTTRLDDLVTALEEGAIAGAGLDVYETEPLPAEHPLWGMPNVLLTPHVAVKDAAHLDARRYAIVTDNVRRFAAGEPLVNVVDKRMWF